MLLIYFILLWPVEWYEAIKSLIAVIHNYIQIRKILRKLKKQGFEIDMHEESKD